VSKHVKHAHSWLLCRWLSRRVCNKCGLVELRNERSRLAALASCQWWEE
jgi:hypothetical protein